MASITQSIEALRGSSSFEDRLVRAGMIGRFTAEVKYAEIFARHLSKAGAEEAFSLFARAVGNVWTDLDELLSGHKILSGRNARQRDLFVRANRDDLESIRWVLSRSEYIDSGDLDQLFLTLDKVGARLPPLVQEPMEDIPDQLLYSTQWWGVTKPVLSPLKRVAFAYLSRVEDPNMDGYVDLTIREEREGWESRGKKGDLEAIEEALRIFTSTD